MYFVALEMNLTIFPALDLILQLQNRIKNLKKKDLYAK